MKLQIDTDICMAHGRCYALAPHLVDVDDEGYPVLTPAGLDLADSDKQLADEVAGSCPELAITLVQS